MIWAMPERKRCFSIDVFLKKETHAWEEFEMGLKSVTSPVCVSLSKETIPDLRSPKVAE